MATRCFIEFISEYNEDKVLAMLYKHNNGYPEYVVPLLKEFMSQVIEQSKIRDCGTRLNDPSYLASKFVVFLARQDTRVADCPLVFSDVGVIMHRPSDVSYMYRVICSIDELNYTDEGTTLNIPIIKPYKLERNLEGKEFWLILDEETIANHYFVCDSERT